MSQPRHVFCSASCPSSASFLNESVLYSFRGSNGANDVIADKNVVTKIMNNYTGLQRIELNGFAKRHWKNGYYPFAYGWCLGLC